jgi:hypothetical protein
VSFENDDQAKVPDWGPLTEEEETLGGEFSESLHEFEEDVDLDDEGSLDLDAGVSLAEDWDEEPEGP